MGWPDIAIGSPNFPTSSSYCLPNYCQPGNVSTSEFDPNILGCQMPPVLPIYLGIRFA
jgi:hypothetical protein